MFFPKKRNYRKLWHWII